MSSRRKDPILQNSASRSVSGTRCGPFGLYILKTANFGPRVQQRTSYRTGCYRCLGRHARLPTDSEKARFVAVGFGSSLEPSTDACYSGLRFHSGFVGSS